MKKSKMIQMAFSLGMLTVCVLSMGCAGKELPVTSDPTVVTLEESSVAKSSEQEFVLIVLDTSEDVLVTSSMEEPTEETKEMETQAEESFAETTTEGSTVVPDTEKVIKEVPTTEELGIEETTTQPVPTETVTTEEQTTEETITVAVVPIALSAKVKGDFYIGDNLSASDFTVIISMSDGSMVKNPAGWSADQLYLGTSQTVITVSYQGLTAQVTVNASEKPTEAPTTEAPTEAPTDPPVEVPIQPQLSYDRAAAEAAWTIQKGIIESQAFNLDTMGYTGYPIQWSERLYDLACQRAKEIVDNFSHDGFHAIDASAENIAKNVPSADMVIDGWYNSAGHKKNMLGGWDYGAIAKYGNYWVALFSNNP